MKINKGIKAGALKKGVDVRFIKMPLSEFDLEDIGAPYPYVILTDADVSDVSDNAYYEKRFFTVNGAVMQYVGDDVNETGDCVGDWVELMQLPDGFAIPTDVESLGSACIHTELPYLYIPGNIKNINHNAFEQCPKLKFIVVTSGFDEENNEEVVKARFEKMLEGNFKKDLQVITIWEVNNNFRLEILIETLTHSKIPQEFLVDTGSTREYNTLPAIVKMYSNADRNSKSYVAINCIEPAKIKLRSNGQLINLDKGLNIITVEAYPELAYGFCTPEWDDQDGFSFEKLPGIFEIDLLRFDSSQVTTMEAMFAGMCDLRHIILTGLDTSKVTNMDYMFYGCEKLRNIDLSSFNTSSVSSMYRMFEGCGAMEALDLSGFDMSKVTSYCDMFTGLTGVVDLSNWNFSQEEPNNILINDPDGNNIDCVIMKNCTQVAVDIINEGILDNDYSGYVIY